MAESGRRVNWGAIKCLSSRGPYHRLHRLGSNASSGRRRHSRAAPTNIACYPLALARPGPGCEPLFERAFESVHADISASRLPHDALETLARFLPDVYWWQQWDNCLRLRIAVVAVYVNAELDPRSFRRLTSDSTLFNRLVHLASDTKRGRHFLRRVPD
jgi:hypothetical protein